MANKQYFSTSICCSLASPSVWFDLTIAVLRRGVGHAGWCHSAGPFVLSVGKILRGQIDQDNRIVEVEKLTRTYSPAARRHSPSIKLEYRHTGTRLSTPFRKYAYVMKSMHFGSWQGAKRSDTGWYREDLQRRHGPKGAISCGCICEMGYLGSVRTTCPTWMPKEKGNGPFFPVPGHADARPDGRQSTRRQRARHPRPGDLG